MLKTLRPSEWSQQQQNWACLNVEKQTGTSERKNINKGLKS